jgi:glycosyltransferase involved in cell wall biosynthesis
MEVREKVLHIITVSFVINHFFGKQFLYLKEKTANEYHLGCTSSVDFLRLSNELGYIPFEVEITRSISPLKDIKAIIKVYQYIKKNKIDKVVGHTPKGGMVAMIAAFFANVSNRIYYRHGIIYETSRGFKRNFLKNTERLTGFLAKQVVCVSNSVKEISERDNLNHTNKNIVLGNGTCNGIDTVERFNPVNRDISEIIALKERFEISSVNKVVGYVGRLVKDKGIDDLIAAWNFVKLKFPMARLLLVGPIEEKDAISEYTKKQIVSDSSIIHIDFVDDASPYFLMMNVFVLPTYREGFPTVSLEASSMGLPVVITKATGCEEAIKENQTGLFTSNEPLDIAAKLLFYLENDKIAKLHGKMGRLFVRENFEQTRIWDLMSEQLVH